MTQFTSVKAAKIKPMIRPSIKIAGYFVSQNTMQPEYSFLLLSFIVAGR